MECRFYLDEMLRTKVENALRLLSDGKYEEARKAIDTAYFILGTKNIVEQNFPFPIT